MMEMQHPAAERLEAFVEGALERADRVVVESHLVGCPRCQAEVEEWRALFAALSGLPQFDPSLGFADRVMAGVRVRAASGWQSAWEASWRDAWQQSAARAGALADRVTPRTSFGWGLAAALMALPVLLGGGVVAWLVSQSYLTPQTLWAWTSDTLVQGLQGIGTTAIGAVLQTDMATWLLSSGSEFVSTAGMTGIGLAMAVAGAATMLSVWVLYRNLFRTPTRESHYVTYSF
jgi:anti-sigma factor RsiW